MHCSGSVTALSIPSAALTQAPQPPMKTATAAPQSNAGGAPTFHDQLHGAMQDGKSGDAKGAGHRSSGGDEKRDTAKKKDSSPAQLVATVALQSATQATTPPAMFGLPSAGVESGVEPAPAHASGSEDAAPAQPSIGGQAAQDTSVSLPAESPAPPSTSARVEPEAQLAFALRLVDQTPASNGSPAPSTAIPAPKDADSRGPNLPPAPQALKQSPDITLAATPGFAAPAPRHAEQGLSPKPSAAAKVSEAAVPGIESAPPRLAEQSGLPSDFNSSKNGDDNRAPSQQQLAFDGKPLRRASTASDPNRSDRQIKDPKASQTPDASESKPLRQASEAPDSNTSKNRDEDSGTNSTPPASELKPLRQVNRAPDPEVVASAAIPAQMPGPTPILNLSTPISSPAPLPGSTLTATVPAQQIAQEPPLRPSATSAVSDISVTVAAPGADLPAQQVAIRMVQRGEEIHVSVRTPDNQLAQSLRQDLGKLSTSLDQSGFRTESWRPVAAATASAQSNANPQRDAQPGNPNRDAPGSGARSSGNGGGDSQEQKRRQQDDRPRWIAELEQQNNR